MDKKNFELKPEHFLSLRFTGEVEQRDLHGKSDFKGSLFFARAGDIIYSKIDVRNGAIGIVPENVAIATVTSEFPVYRIKKDVALSEYIQLVFRTEHFRRIINGMVSGASGRKRVQPDELEVVEVPLPSLVEQAAIIARWRKAQGEISAVRERVKKLEARLSHIVYQELGVLPPLPEKPIEKCLVVWWQDLTRWSFNFLSRATQGLLGFTQSRFPIEPLGNHLLETMNGYCIKPVPEPTSHKMLKLNALQPDGLDLTKSKFIKISDKIAERFSVHKGDLFICRSVGSYEHVAKCSLGKEDAANIVFPDTMIRARFKNSLLSEYVGEVIQTPLGRSFFQSNARTAVGMWKIGADDISNFPIPIPPLKEQRQIMQRMVIARAEIAGEREAASALEKEINADVEAIILGSKILTGK